MNHSPNQEEAVVEAALKLPPEQRAAYLDQACGDDSDARELVGALLRVEELLESRQRADSPGGSSTVRASGKTIFLSPPVAEKPGDSVGRYKLLEQIGEGGYGVVYLAEQEEPIRRRVALKVIKPGMDSRQVLARFEAERQALALMDHPNIAKVLDAGATDSGRPYFVMELVKGVRITTYCDQVKLPTRGRLELFAQVCQAIQHAHQKGVIHRDIKPSNVLVSLHDGAPVPKVIDFGIAKATMGQPLTDLTLFTPFDQFIGTPAYMSPEQAELTTLDIDTRSDIYSLGVLLYELLTGKTPFDAKELAKKGLDEMRRVIREEDPARPSTRLGVLEADEQTTIARCRQTEMPKLLSIIRGDLDWIVMKTLEKDRARRYETANGLAMEITRYLNDEPVLARPPSQLYRFQKLVRRNKLAFGAAGAVCVALLLGLGTSTCMFWREREAKSEQRHLRQQAEAAATKSQQVAQFLKEMLEGVGPSVALGRDPTLLREILDKTSERVGKDLIKQPEVEAELLRTLGEVYFVLAQYDQAEKMLSRGLLLHSGREGPETANSLDSLALALYGQGKLAEAERIGRQALGMQRQVLGKEHVRIATSLNNLGITLQVAGKWPEAEATYRQALAMRTNLLGNEHAEVAVSLNCLAQLLWEEGKMAEADTLQRRGLAIQRKVLDVRHPDLAISLKNLANQLQVRGKLDEAEPLYQEAIGIERVSLGKDHPELATSLNNFGVLLERMGLWAEAERTHREALAIRQRVFTNDHPQVAFSLNNLGNVLAGQGRLDDAEALHRQALAMRRRILPQEHPDIAGSLANLARVLREKGKLPEAEDTQQQALAMRRKLFGNDNPAVATSLSELALVFRDQGRLAEAESKQTEALALRRKLLGPEDTNRAVSAENLALVLCEQGKFSDAEALANESLAIRQKNSPNDWRSFSVQSLLGDILAGEKKYVQAEPLLRAGFEGMAQRQQRIPASSRPQIKEALQRLVHLYEVTERSVQAAEYKGKLEQLGNQPSPTKQPVPSLEHL